MDILTYNGKPFSDFDTFFDGKDLFTIPTEEGNFYSVVGRNGDVFISNEKFNNIERVVHCFIRNHFRENYLNLMNFLKSERGYKRFESSKEPDVFMEALFVSEVSPNTGSFLHSGTFDLTFNFKPQKWLKSGEQGISIPNAKTIINPTQFEAKPLIKVSGVGTITINGIELSLNANTSTTYIDCEVEDCYEGTINRNSDLECPNGFPTLIKGNNTISVDGCSIILYPRWWRL